MAHDPASVVVTGMGAVTPLGAGVDNLWRGVSSGRSGIDWIERADEFDPAHYPVRFAGEVKNFAVDDHLKRHCEVRNERGVQMGLVAARDALCQAGLLDSEDRLADTQRTIAAIVGSGHGPCQEAEIGFAAFFQKGPKAVRPTTIPKSMFNALSSNASIYFGLTGANLVIASACASGAAAIGLGTLLIRHGYAELVLAGAADAPLTPALLASWSRLRVLAQHDEPVKACRPFDLDRGGIVLGEGAAMVVLESRESALRRGVTPLASVTGYGTASDAVHVTAPSIGGQRRAIECCLADARVEAASVDYINAHGTGTAANDATEAQAIVDVFGSRGTEMPVSSTKSMLGHALGASGAIEFVICVLALAENFVPPTINCDRPDPQLGLDYVPNQGRPHVIRTAMSNSFAFGGNNVTLLLRREP